MEFASAAAGYAIMHRTQHIRVEMYDVPQTKTTLPHLDSDSSIGSRSLSRGFGLPVRRRCAVQPIPLQDFSDLYPKDDQPALLPRAA